MLYVTTRNSQNIQTAHRALCEKRGEDGGCYVPWRFPVLDQESIYDLARKPFNQCLAECVNLLFNTRLDRWDMDFCVGRHPVRLSTMSHRIALAECWHNPQGELAWMETALANRIRVRGSEDDLGDWVGIALRLGILMGIFGQLIRSGLADKENKVDISVVSGDFSAVLACRYARELGLPVGNIICCCNENSFIWELIHHGELRTGAVAVNTLTPEADIVVPPSLERLIYHCAGDREVRRYVEVCRRGGVYRPDDIILSRIRKGMDVSVVSRMRIESAIANVFRTNSYILGPYTALAYAGFLDYRSRTGENRYGLILSEKSPVRDISIVSGAMCIPEEDLKKRILEM